MDGGLRAAAGSQAFSPGTSDGSTSPWRRQPTRSSHVRGRATSGAPLRSESGWRPSAASRRTSAPSSRRRDVRWRRARRSGSSQVSACIEQDVGEGPAHLARRAQAAVVVAAVEHRPAAATHPIDGAREPGANAHHAAGERLLAVRLDDQVRVVSLERVVRDTEASALARLGQGAPPLVDKRPRRSEGTPGHTRRVTWTGQSRHGRSLAVQHARPRAARSSRSGSRPASPGAHPMVGERELLGLPRHPERLGRSY